jgi:hypothetical protein
MHDPEPTLPPRDPDPEPVDPVPGPNPDEPGPDVLPQTDPLVPMRAGAARRLSEVALGGR